MIMKFAIAFAALCVVPEVAAQAPKMNTSSIKWYPCPQNESLPFSCGSLEVPLDYTNLSSAKTLVLSLVKVNATRQPSRGSILFNPGGPGIIGRSFFLGGMDKAMLNFTGGDFDLISFDPRGTGETVPFSCYANASTRDPYSLLLPTSSNLSDTAVGRTWAVQSTFSESCFSAQRETGELIGTAFVARDMMRIVDALGEDGLLRFWGFSYGTALGATVAAMFPERMDKVVLDGVLNMHQYYAGNDVDQLKASDRAFANFLEACVASPGECTLARNGTSVGVLSRQIDQMLDSIRYQPLNLGTTQLTDIVEYGLVKVLILQGLRAPSTTWPVLADLFNAISTQNLTAWRQNSALLLGITSQGETFPNTGLDALFGVRCGDVRFRTNSLAAVQPIVTDFWKTSRYIGDVLTQGQPILCPQWKLNARERYEGNFQVQTRNPILLIGSPFDPLTPLVAAQNVSADFTRSVVLQHNGNGHCSISQPSTCTIKAIRGYFANGTLPAPGTQCFPDTPVFIPTTSAGARKFLARSVGTDEDAALLEAALQMSKDLARLARMA